MSCMERFGTRLYHGTTKDEIPSSPEWKTPQTLKGLNIRPTAFIFGRRIIRDVGISLR